MASFDVLIRGARVVDGTGNPWFHGDVALHADRIAAIVPPGQIAFDQAAEVVHAAGLVVCPGFIDLQSHSILPLMIDGRSVSKITQGVTTEIMGEAWTPAPFGGQIDDPLKNALFMHPAAEWSQRMRGWTRFGDWLDAMIEHGVSPNIGSFLGGGTLRNYAMGMTMDVADDHALDMMRRVTREAMDDGAFGVSYALIYPPDAYARTDELIEVCKVVSACGGLYITHLRSEADQVEVALEEALEIGRQAQLPVELYHLKAAGQRNWHKMPHIIARIAQARAEGQDVTADMYPYTAAGTGLTSVLPPWADADGKLYDNLRDPMMRARIRAEALAPRGDWEAMADLCGPGGVMPIGFMQPEFQQYVGKTLAEIAAMRKQEWIDAALDLLAAEQQRTSTIYFMMDEDNLQLQLQQPWITISTDAGGLDPAWAAERGPYHPRAYGTYTRVLGTYVRDEGVITLEDAVRKMSGAVAGKLGLRDRGLLRVGNYADVVVFDPTTVADRATFTQPHQLSTGVQHVWINGRRVLHNGEHTGALPGRIVRGAACA